MVGGGWTENQKRFERKTEKGNVDGREKTKTQNRRVGVGWTEKQKKAKRKTENRSMGEKRNRGGGAREGRKTNKKVDKLRRKKCG